jgi:hypothetical protein
MSRELDVVIIGGGIQGLVALDALVDRGYACALVTDGDLGSGQSLHSHGFLFTGFGMFGDHLQRASADIVQPYLRARGIEPTGEWFLIPPPGFPTGFPAAALPDGFGDSLGEIVRTPDRSFPKHRLVQTLSRKHPDRVVRGRVTLAPAGQRTPAVTVQPAASGEELALNGKVIIVAAGCGSKRILQGLVGDTQQTEQIRHRRVHMICVRGPRGLLPTISVTAMPLGVTLAAHDQPDSDNVIWYVTPLEFGGPSFDDIPGDAASVVDPATVARGFEALLQLYPALPEVEHLELGCYAGYRQEIGDQPGVRCASSCTTPRASSLHSPPGSFLRGSTWDALLKSSTTWSNQAAPSPPFQWAECASRLARLSKIDPILRGRLSRNLRRRTCSLPLNPAAEREKPRGAATRYAGLSRA